MLVAVYHENHIALQPSSPDALSVAPTVWLPPPRFQQQPIAYATAPNCYLPDEFLAEYTLSALLRVYLYPADDTIARARSFFWKIEATNRWVLCGDSLNNI